MLFRASGIGLNRPFDEKTDWTNEKLEASGTGLKCPHHKKTDWTSEKSKASGVDLMCSFDEKTDYTNEKPEASDMKLFEALELLAGLEKERAFLSSQKRRMKSSVLQDAIFSGGHYFALNKLVIEPQVEIDGVQEKIKALDKEIEKIKKIIKKSEEKSLYNEKYEY